MPEPSPPRLHFIASDAPEAQGALADLTARYRQHDPHQADLVVALGGDGLMLEVLHRFIGHDTPIYGMNRGSVGFLMNPYEPQRLPERIAGARAIDLNPLRMQATQIGGHTVEALAINEVSLLRETRQAAKLRITVDGVQRLPELVCDGALVATPAGSTAYNMSVYGPILPLEAQLLALTPISAFRPRRWRGALLRRTAVTVIDVLEPEKRPVSAVADFTEVRDVMQVRIAEDPSVQMRLLFDPDHSLDERIIKEQFAP